MNPIDATALTPKVLDFLASVQSSVVLHDGHLSAEAMSRVEQATSSPLTLLDVREATTDAVASLPPGSHVLYACLQDDLGLPFVNEAYTRQLRVHPVHYAQPRSYLSRNDVARRVLAEEIQQQRHDGYLKLDFGPADFVNLIQAFEATRHRPGCIVEVGCYRGSSAGALLAYIRSRQSERGFPSISAHFLDVFSGFDYPEARASSDVVWAGTHQTDGYEVVRDRIRAYGHDVPGLCVDVHRCNVISDPIPDDICRAGVRLANIDVDLYEATVAGLAKFAPLVVPGGIMICEDAGHTPLLIGAFKAVEEFVSSDAGRPFVRVDLPSGQTFLIKTAG